MQGKLLATHVLLYFHRRSVVSIITHMHMHSLGSGMNYTISRKSRRMLQLPLMFLDGIIIPLRHIETSIMKPLLL